MTTIFSALNMLFSLRNPAIIITTYVAQLVAYPLGVAWSKVLPNRQFNVFGLKFNLNPGPFNYKEHGLVVLMANASYGGGPAYFTDILTAQKAFYGFDFGVGYAIILGLTSQCIGFGLAGLVRIWLVEPASMIWPQDLVSCAFMYTLHDHSKTNPAKANGWSISRYRYFFIVAIGSFCWYWVPGFLFQALATFTFPTFIAPDNVTVNKVFGSVSGMGLLPLTLDWTTITAFITSPLIYPWHAIVNTLIGVIFFFWIVCAGLHWSGTFYADYLPFSDSGSFDNTQKRYNVSRILNAQNTFDQAAYAKYSPIFLSTTFTMAYGLSFAGIVAMIVHAVLFHSKEIWMRWRDKTHALDDIHAKMMRKYPRVPAWWFMCVFLPMFALTFVAAYKWPTDMPWWSIIVAIIVAIVWLIPVGLIQAITNIQLGLNVFTELIAGYMLPGRPTANMMFKTYGYISMTQALAFTQDMKLGHYLKLPPRTMFFGQVIATAWSSLVQVGVFYWAMGALKNVCKEDAVANFTCPGGRVFFTASIIYGVIGPSRFFSGDAIYTKLQYFWVVGAALPFLFWCIHKKWPHSLVRYLNAPVIFAGSGQIPPATALNYLAWGIVGLVFNRYIRNKFRGWWMRFNYVTSAALDSGLAISTIIVVLTLSLTNTEPPKWWGNEVIGKTSDAMGTAVKIILKPGDTFGPKTWS